MANELIIELPKTNALQVFTEPKGIDPYLDKIRTEALSHVPDISTKTGRAAIASIAAKVAKSKVYLEDAGKQLCDQERAKIDATLSAVMASRKRIKEELDALRDEVRKPLTEWEDSEAERKGKIESRIEAMKRLPEIGSDSAAIEKHLKRLEATEINESFGEYTAEAAIARTHAIHACKSRLDAQIKIEQDLKELETLRIKQAEQAQKDRDAEIARKAAENAKLKAERESQEKINEANRLVAEALRREEDAKAAQKEKERIEKEKKEKAEAEENARIADSEYRQRVIEESVQSLIDCCGFDYDLAIDIVTAIDKGEIKNIFIKF